MGGSLSTGGVRSSSMGGAVEHLIVSHPFSLMDMLIFKAVEEQIKKRVENKARIFEQNATDSECKVDPKVLSKLYDQWVMPQTKDVEVEYLLCFLD
ncbi:Chorismate mutase 2 [Zea mays]|uniref:chorismate mutase n=1 Tax=Zea mays TaxID=4577 RepID=A0A1D6LIQ2_MAIZE|nr:Chorismate mutase 2 [Zea mays]